MQKTNKEIITEYNFIAFSQSLLKNKSGMEEITGKKINMLKICSFKVF